MAGEARRLAGVEALGGEEFFQPRVDAVGDPGEDVGALRDRHLAPRARERGLGGADGRVDLRLAAFGNAADHAVVEGRAVVPELAGRPFGERAVDEMGGGAARAVEAHGRLSQSLNRHRCTSFPTALLSKLPGPISPFFSIVDIFINIDINRRFDAMERLGSVERRSRAGRGRRPIVVFRAARDADRADDRSVLDDRQAAAEQDHARAEGDAVMDHRIVFQGV